jgi:hypothetical protein
MKYTRKLLTLAFTLVLLISAAAISVSAQQRRVNRSRVIVRPVIVQPYYYSYDWYWNRYYNPFYRDFYYNPYVELQRQRNYLQGELNGNQRELQKHLEKYNADGVITAKEREELNDDYRDVERARRNLAEFNRRYGR